MKQHKWHKEIKAWADGAIIQFELNGKWIDCQDNDPAWQLDTGYRIKPQPKEPQYLYVYGDTGFTMETCNTGVDVLIKRKKIDTLKHHYIGKIKLEVE